MFFPLGIQDLMLLLAFSGIILFITAELLSPFYGSNRIYLNRKRLKHTAPLFAGLSLITVVLRIVNEFLLS